jgi:integrase
VARRRLQQQGDLYQQGGWWKLRWREDQIGADGRTKRGWSKPVWIGPAAGSGRLTEKEARRIAWDNFLSRLDQNTRTPQSVMTLSDFVERKFIPEHVAMLKIAGRTHYHAILKHVLKPEDVDRMFLVPAEKSKAKLKTINGWPYLGDLRLRDARQDDIQRLISAALNRGYSTQTVKHIRNVASAIFTHAKRKQWYSGDNPASFVTLPEMSRKEAHALTFAQMKAVLAAMRHPEREMALIAVLTSMNVAEICGLQWKRVNLTDAWANVDGEAVPPRTIAVRKQWYRGELGSVKKKSRIRNLPIPESLLPTLIELSRRRSFTGPEDYVLVSRAGTPIDEHNIAARRLKPIGAAVSMPWLSWHVFRRTHTTLAKELGMQFQDRMAMMGHSDARMTMLYTVEDIDRRRKVLDEMAAKLMGREEGPAKLTAEAETQRAEKMIGSETGTIQ